MATRYVRSTDGNNSDDGSTWALAKADLAGVAAIDTAGDTIFVSDNHAESTASAVTLAFAGTAASPTRIICGDDAAEPPTAVSEAATVTTTGGSSLTISGNLYVRGIAFEIGTGAVSNSIAFENAANGVKQVYEKCKFKLNNNGGTSQIALSSGGSGYEWINCDIRFANASQFIQMHSAKFRWRGGSLLAGGTSPTSLIQYGGVNQHIDAIIDGVDLSAAAAAVNLTSVSALGGQGTITFRNCKLPASWSGELLAGTPNSNTNCRSELFNCDSGDTNYKVRIHDFTGSLRDETTLVRTGGASDGDTTISWKIVTSADAEYPAFCFVTPEIGLWNTTTGSSKTLTVEILHDSVTNLKDDEVWLEVLYLGTSGVPLGTHVRDSKADYLATAADQTTSSETWTTTGMSNPNKQSLSVTFTPQEKGFYIAKVYVAKASKTLYVDPKVTVT